MRNRIVIYALPFILSIVYFFSQFRFPFYLVDPASENEKQPYPISLSSDKTDHGGNTELKLLKNSKNLLSFDYTLKPGHLFVYASAGWLPLKDQTFDLSSYDEVRMTHRASRGIRPQLILHNLEASPEFPDRLKTVFRQHTLPATKEWNTIQIPMQDLYIPEWWFMVENARPKDYTGSSYNQVTGIYISNCINLPMMQTDRIEVRALSFHCNPWPLVRNGLLFLMGYFSVMGLWKKWKNKKRPMPVRFIAEDKNRPYDSEEQRKLFDFITTRYMEELSLRDIQRETGIAAKNISQLLLIKTGLTYKQFLTQLRMTEAKRLLRESDRQVAEIAFQVGFGNVSHFNRVFKKEEGCSPIEYRKASAHS